MLTDSERIFKDNLRSFADNLPAAAKDCAVYLYMCVSECVSVSVSVRV